MTDPSRTIVSPVEPVLKPDSEAGFLQLISVIELSEADGVVVGLPLGLSGERTQQSLRAEGFGGRLAGAISPIWVEMLDERHTTSIARSLGGGASEDSRAAAVLLERWLELNPQ